MDDIAGAPQQGGYTVDARFIPAPTTVSEHARRVLSARRAAEGYPPVQDKAAWTRRLAEIETLVGGMFAGVTADLDVTTRDITLGGVTVYESIPGDPARDFADCAVLEIHGGALVAMGGPTCKLLGGLEAVRTGLKTFSVDYRMPPAHPYPAALDDCVAAYKALLALYPASKIAVTGSSAGGNLAAALALRARDEGLPAPAALVLLTPEVDLTESGDSFQTHAGLDTNLTGPLMQANLLYADGHDLTDPYVSPLFGDFTRGYPPTFLSTGTRDLFLSNTVRMHRALRRAGIEADLHVFEAMPHGGFWGAPEDAELHGEARAFIHAHLQRG
jgi:monoterpene epsilon-lactone hydrolase